MKEQTFNYIWEELVVKSVRSIEERLPEEEKISYDFCVKDLERSKYELKKVYNRIKGILKSDYYNVNGRNNEPVNRIDNHKIAACICCGLIQTKPFGFRVDKDIPLEILISNYELAYTVSLGFIYTTLIAQYLEVGREDLAEKLLNQKCLMVPSTSKGHDAYNAGRIYTLALNDVYGNDFDVLTYSDMMFWIEFYNRQRIEDTFEPIPLIVCEK